MADDAFRLRRGSYGGRVGSDPPCALLVTLVEWRRPIRFGASLLVIGFGVFRLLNQRHPRALARIRPTQPGLCSFAVARARRQKPSETVADK
jgi:hypothetical protein